MQIYIHIGLPYCGAPRIQSTLDDKRDQLISKGVLYPRTPGRKNHTRLYMAVSDPDHIDPLRWNRGYGSARAQAELAETVASQLASEINDSDPDKLIVSAEQFSASLTRETEITRLYDVLRPFGDDFRIIAHVDEQARLLARHYAGQILEGRMAPLSRELDIAQGDNWWQDCLRDWVQISPLSNKFPEIQAPPPWLDYTALIHQWEQVFGKKSVSLRAFDPKVFKSTDLTREISAAFDLPNNIGKAERGRGGGEPAAAWLSRSRETNKTLTQTLHAGRIIARPLWHRLLGQLEISGDPIEAGALSAVSDHFEADNQRLTKEHGALSIDHLRRDPARAVWQEADPERGFRTSQYMTVFLPQIDKATLQERKSKQDVIATLSRRHQANGANDETAKPSATLPPLALANYNKLSGGRFAPHNNIGRVNEEELAAQYSVVPKRILPDGSTGNVIVACMKNEAPYIVEWVAYHRAIGVDNIIVYSNGCEDGTTEILDHLQDMGAIQHRNNDGWKGNSPQQYALNQSLKEPLIQNADWIIHIDVDEFINIRTGNGTLADFLATVPDATNIAMTWRLFGHNGVKKFADLPVIEQFDTCAPKYCPKPHTVWGFKTMFKNLGAYEKISCHRPNKLRESHRNKVAWVNGSGVAMGEEVKEKGWRSEVKSIGYDLIQLNHYALRSAESFLIKRQRGRALHVDRTIGINYWVRMDWSHNKDITIQRNTTRLHHEMDALFANDALAALHQTGVAWHHAKADELHQQAEFKDLFDEAMDTKLTELERVAYALALDMES